jgi:hypothetical protein
VTIGASSSLGLTDLKYSPEAQLTSTREAAARFFSCAFKACVIRSPQNAYRSLPRVLTKRVLVNCASGEYFKSVKPKLLDAPIVTPVFEDWKGGRYKIISFHAKRARGLMARYAVENRLDKPEQLKDFDSEGYAFDAEASNDSTYVFRRRIAD